MGLKIQNNFLIPIWGMQVGSRAFVTVRHSFAHFGLDSGLPPMKVIFEQKKSSFENMKSYLDTHLRVVHVVLIPSEDV